MRRGKPARIFADAVEAFGLHGLRVAETALPTVAGAWTRGVDAKVGAEYVEGIVREHNIGGGAAAQLAKLQYYYFALNEPFELSVDEMELGERLRQTSVPDQQILDMSRAGDLLIVTGTIVARTLLVMVGDHSEAEADVHAVADPKTSAAISGSSATRTSLALESDTPLAFAFSARKLRLSADGRLDFDYGRDIKAYGVVPDMMPIAIRAEPTYLGEPEELIEILEGLAPSHDADHGSK